MREMLMLICNCGWELQSRRVSEFISHLSESEWCVLANGCHDLGSDSAYTHSPAHVDGSKVELLPGMSHLRHEARDAALQLVWESGARWRPHHDKVLQLVKKIGAFCPDES